jgi:hypothetical protein
MLRGAGVLTIASLACVDRSPPPTPSRTPTTHPSAQAFEQIQARGQEAMGVDQYTSSHRFEPLPDGGLIRLQRDREDSAGTARIRSHMQTIALGFARGNFTLPGFVHAREVPGTAVMAQRRSRITYTADTLPRGGQLRIHSHDPAAVAAIHQFLSFQHRDHRVGGGQTAH